MSNLIKYPFVNMQGKEKVLIRHEEDDQFVPLKNRNMEVIQAAEDDSGEGQNRSFVSQKVRQGQKGNELSEKKKEEAEQQAEWILNEAREQADQIRKEAEAAADSLRQASKEEGKRMGHEEGLLLAAKEMDEVRMDLEAARQSLEDERAGMASEMEKQYVEILCNLLCKLTGVLLQDQKDVLLHLIRSGLSDMPSSDHYVLRVSPEDLPRAEKYCDTLMTEWETKISIEVKEEKGLSENDCIIEADTQMIDCGFQTQLDNLITTLHMLV